MAVLWGAELSWRNKIPFVSLPWWLNPFPSSLQVKLHLYPRRHTVSPFLRLFFGLWIMYMDPSFIRNYEIPLKSVKNSLWSKYSIRLLISIETFRNPFVWDLSHLVNHVSIAYLSQDIARVSGIFLADVLWSSRIMEWMTSMFSGIVTWVCLLCLQCSNGQF
jgi:hypothetical protein